MYRRDFLKKGSAALAVAGMPAYAGQFGSRKPVSYTHLTLPTIYSV